ncbi:MAG: alpha/beta hydrolase [Pseudomonadota bacterium]
MAERDATLSLPPRSDAPTLSWGRRALSFALLAVALICLFLMERRFDGLTVETTAVGPTPVTIYRSEGADPAPLVVVAHGFGGSRQMMDQIAVTLARAGFVVGSLDLPGHGRSDALMSPEVTVIEGTTMQLVASVREVAEALRERPDVAGPISFVGHSMATDVAIRAAAETEGVAAVGAVSMYSEAVKADFPESLLIVSGASEDHLRQVGLDAIRLIDPAAEEGAVVANDAARRMALSAWGVGHVGVLYHQTTLEGLARWLAEAADARGPIRADLTGVAAGLLFAALALLAPFAARLIPAGGPIAEALPRKTFLIAIAVPIPFAFAAAVFAPGAVGGVLGFGSLIAALLAWGAVQLAVLHRMGVRIPRPDPLAIAATLAMGVLFALAMDRYGGAFLPTGQRLTVMAMLMIATLPFMLADARLMAGAPMWRRFAGRVPIIVTLSLAMALAPTEMGLTFTVLPVMALFFLVFGLFQRVVSDRRGWSGAGLASGVMLAWALASTTPLFAVAA